MERAYKNCQSCGMPMKRDPQGGGTKADGNKSKMYCSHCYHQGRFTQNITVNEMREQVKGKLKDFGFPGFMTGLFTRNINKLERWKVHSMAVE